MKPYAFFYPLPHPLFQSLSMIPLSFHFEGLKHLYYLLFMFHNVDYLKLNLNNLLITITVDIGGTALISRLSC